MLDDGVALLGGRTRDPARAVRGRATSWWWPGSTGAAGRGAGRTVRPHPAVVRAARGRGRSAPASRWSSRRPADRRDRYPDLDRPAASTFDPAFVVVPLKDALGRPFGSMGVGFATAPTRTGGEADRDLFENVAAQCALALDRARLADAAERDQDQLGFLDELSATLSSSLQIDTALVAAGGDGRAPHRRLVRRAPDGLAAATLAR